MTPIYTTTVHATGDGRNGHVSSDDGIIELPVLMPKELGGAGGATNPEQLFAAGYAACFHSALRLVAGFFRALPLGLAHGVKLSDNYRFGHGKERGIELGCAQSPLLDKRRPKLRRRHVARLR